MRKYPYTQKVGDKCTNEDVKKSQNRTEKKILIKKKKNENEKCSNKKNNHFLNLIYTKASCLGHSVRIRITINDLTIIPTLGIQPFNKLNSL